MIKLFRKLRQELVETGKTGRYLKYAIGEIVLVVIGILIALSISNWNEERKIENMGKEYTREIYAELKKEISNLNEILVALRTQYDGTENVLLVIESSEKLITDTLEFTNNHWAPTRLFIIQRDLNTFDELRSSGQSRLLKNDSLSHLLDRFYENFDVRITNFKGFPSQIRIDLRRIVFPMGNVDDHKYEERTEKLSPAYLSEYLNSEAVYETLLSILKTCEYNIRFFEETMVKATNLMSYMEATYPELKSQN
jgi:Family of unknown function (DUF6090)